MDVFTLEGSQASRSGGTSLLTLQAIMQLPQWLIRPEAWLLTFCLGCPK